MGARPAAVILTVDASPAAQDAVEPAAAAPGQPFSGKSGTQAFQLLDNGDFREQPPALLDGRGQRRIPWWRSSHGATQLESLESLPCLRTGPGEWANQPVAAYAPFVGELIVRGEVAGVGRLTLIDGKGGRATLELGGAGADFRSFELMGVEFASAIGRELMPRLTLELSSAAGQVARWRGLQVEVVLPSPDPAELRAEILAELDWIFALWLDKARDRQGPRETAFICQAFDVVSGAPLQMIPGGAYNLVYELMLAVPPALRLPVWEAALDRFLVDYLKLCLHPDTGLPRTWDCVRDKPNDGGFVEIALPLSMLIDVAQEGSHPRRDAALEAARRIGETVLARGVLPDGAVAPKYRSSDGEPNTHTIQLRALDLPAQLVRLAQITGDERYIPVAQEAVALLEYTHTWSGSWRYIDPGFDDTYGHFGERSVKLWEERPDDPIFQGLALGGYRFFAPLWRDALRLGGNVAADQIRCWRIFPEVARLAEFEGAELDELVALLSAAARLHFKGEQYGSGAWGDVTILDFDPKDNLEVGDLSGTPQNIMQGLGALHGLDLPLPKAELRAMFSAVMRSTRTEYAREHGYLATRRQLAGVNLCRGSLRCAAGLVEMLKSL